MGALFRSAEAIGKKFAHLVRKAKQLAKNAKILLNRWWHNIWQYIKGPVIVAKGLTVIFVAVIVANHLAIQVSGQFHLTLPSETMQVLVGVMAAYFLKKS